MQVCSVTLLVHYTAATTIHNELQMRQTATCKQKWQWANDDLLFLKVFHSACTETRDFKGGVEW